MTTTLDSPRSARFWNRMAPRYARTPIKDEAAYAEKLAMTRELFTSDTRVLEFGCGTGGTAMLHAPHVAHVHAIDGSEKMIDIARRRARTDAIEGVSFETSSIEAFDPGMRRFDVVLGLSVMQLVDDRGAVIRKVHELLRPGGHFVTSTPCIADSLPALRFVTSPLGALGLIPPLQVFTSKELVDDMIRGGFRVERRWQPGDRKAVFVVCTRQDAYEPPPRSVRAAATYARSSSPSRSPAAPMLVRLGIEAFRSAASTADRTTVVLPESTAKPERFSRDVEHPEPEIRFRQVGGKPHSNRDRPSARRTVIRANARGRSRRRAPRGRRPEFWCILYHHGFALDQSGPSASSGVGGLRRLS